MATGTITERKVAMPTLSEKEQDEEVQETASDPAEAPASVPAEGEPGQSRAWSARAQVD